MSTQVGSIGCGVCVAMFAGPLASIRAVVRERSAAAIPAGFTLFSLANTAAWLAYGLALDDAFVWAPNVLGLAAATAQLGLVVRYGTGGGAAAAAARAAAKPRT